MSIHCTCSKTYPLLIMRWHRCGWSQSLFPRIQTSYSWCGKTLRPLKAAFWHCNAQITTMRSLAPIYTFSPFYFTVFSHNNMLYTIVSCLSMRGVVWRLPGICCWLQIQSDCTVQSGSHFHNFVIASFWNAAKHHGGRIWQNQHPQARRWAKI